MGVKVFGVYSTSSWRRWISRLFETFTCVRCVSYSFVDGPFFSLDVHIPAANLGKAHKSAETSGNSSPANIVAYIYIYIYIFLVSLSLLVNSCFVFHNFLPSFVFVFLLGREENTPRPPLFGMTRLLKPLIFFNLLLSSTTRKSTERKGED